MTEGGIDDVILERTKKLIRSPRFRVENLSTNDLRSIIARCEIEGYMGNPIADNSFIEGTLIAELKKRDLANSNANDEVATHE